MKYGDGALELRVPAEACAGVWGLPRAQRSGAGTDELTGAVRELEAAGWNDRVAGRRLGLLLPDGTRAWRIEDVLGALRPLLAVAGEVRAFLCTGTHASDKPETLAARDRIAAALAGLPGASLHVHDARRDRHADLGRTQRGTDVRVLREAHECEAFLVFSDMRPHYFAGYSNPSKNYVPGLAPLESIRSNHSLTVEDDARAGRHPWHPDPGRRSNPLAEDLAEAFGVFVGERPHFALAVFTSGAEILWAGGGETVEVSGRGMAVADERGSLALPALPYLVVSPGGMPYDESLYQVQRALELSQPATAAGAEVLFLARCGNGIGPPGTRENFIEPLMRPLDEVLAPTREDYVLYAHKPYKLARLVERLGALHVTSDLDPALVRGLHMRPAPDPQAVLDGWIAAGAAPGSIGFLDDAAKVAVLPLTSGA